MATYNLLFRPQALYTPFRKVAFLPLYLLYLGVPLFPHFLSNMALYGAETWTLRQQIRNTWKVLKCGAGGGWRRQLDRSCEK